jgi:hypothetical protein
MINRRRATQFATLFLVYITLLVIIGYMYQHWVRDIIPSRDFRPPVGDAVRANSEK